MRVVLGSDAQGMELKEKMKAMLIQQGWQVIDKSETASIDFVESTLAVAQEILNNRESLGVVFDGYGAGSFMTATKVKGMVAAAVSDERSAYMTREHNDARLITIGAKIVGEELAKNIIKEFLATDYEGGRHQIRVDMLNKMA
ncbi:galactose-6-phosphate isomerase subunit LacA [Enterococcus faecalis]